VSLLLSRIGHIVQLMALLLTPDPMAVAQSISQRKMYYTNPKLRRRYRNFKGFIKSRKKEPLMP
jgi:membrane protein insertase Oxa1/YidC/SpoIIIJ